MELKTKIMFCGVNNLTDGRYAAAIGTEWLGFDFDPTSLAFVDPDKAGVIKGWLSVPMYFAEFNAKQLHHIDDIQQKLGLDFIYIKGFPPIQDLTKIAVPLIIEIDVDDLSGDEIREAFLTYASCAAMFVLRSQGSDYQRIPQQLFEDYPVLLRFNFPGEAAVQALDSRKCAGICLSGGQELKTGVSDFEELQRIVDTLTIEP
jgi:phosphoribosylanthranilate isomerase